MGKVCPWARRLPPVFRPDWMIEEGGRAWPRSYLSGASPEGNGRDRSQPCVRRLVDDLSQTLRRYTRAHDVVDVLLSHRVRPHAERVSELGRLDHTLDD